MKAARLRRIREIIHNKDIETQEELVDALREDGFVVTQATVSRDIKELHLLKRPDSTDSRYVYALPTEPSYNAENKLRRLLEDNLQSIDQAVNLIVIKTLPGNAMAVSALIDAIEWGDVLGTIGGDDTILMICRDAEVAADVVSKLHDMV